MTLVLLARRGSLLLVGGPTGRVHTLRDTAEVGDVVADHEWAGPVRYLRLAEVRAAVSDTTKPVMRRITGLAGVDAPAVEVIFAEGHWFVRDEQHGQRT